MAINIQEDILKLHALGLLDKLLIDRTTKKNILWATDTYSVLGTGYSCGEEITSDLITGKNAGTIKTRAQKATGQQSERTRQHAEVFSPFWVCREMTNYADEMWSETGIDWKKYVNSRQMEITCGEGPYLVSRYDVETGEAVPISERIGLLDRKLKAVNDHTQSEKEWLKWSIRAYRATYGYDYQGDNVLISRVNLLMTFEDYLWERWKRKPTIAEYKKLIAVVTWNLWQMDGLTGAVPCVSSEDEQCQISFFDLLGGTTESTVKTARPRCLVRNWTSGGSIEFLAFPTRGKKAMKFDFVIGNPPYQNELKGESNTATPIYHSFMDAAYELSDVVFIDYSNIIIADKTGTATLTGILVPKGSNYQFDADGNAAQISWSEKIPADQLITVTATVTVTSDTPAPTQPVNPGHTSGGNNSGSTTKPGTTPTPGSDSTNDTQTTPTPTPSTSGENPFTDVVSSAYYYDAVLWAVANGVTTGTSQTTFSPNADCTRAQVVTFVWRAAGSPKPQGTSNKFTDVKAGAYYEDAVLWAVENGITAGTSETTFSPEQVCTRAQVATFLYRTAGSPAVTGSNTFTDVTSDKYYADAVQWAVQQNITNGTSTTAFSPDDTCLRGQIVTFLYRYFAK